MNIRADGLDDRALVERFKRTGDRDWFGALFERHQTRVYAICYALLKNRASAEDLMQDTFERALEEINRFDEKDPGSQFNAWLGAICRNLCLSERRKIKVRRERETRGLDQLDLAPWNPEAIDRLRDLEDKLNRLGQGPRFCWWLFHVDGYTYEEIGHLTGYSFQQVRKYLRIARHQLERMK